MIRQLYDKVDKIIDNVDFNSIWRGFSKFPFALYDKNKVYLKDAELPYDHRFLGNTSIEYDGGYIAIWNVDSPIAEDPETLAADLVHEMFHAFQQKNGERRYPSDLLLLGYPDNMENFVVKHNENLILAQAVEDGDKKKAQQFIAARRYREGLIGDIIKQEYLAETIEGMAEYAGCMALKQISKEKYSNRLSKYILNLRVPDERFFDIRRMLYYTGAVFCILLSETGEDFFHTIGAVEAPLFDLVAGNAAGEKPATEFDCALLSHQLMLHQSDKKRKFDDFLSVCRKETIIDASICGYDPMNMIRSGNSILCTHFIMLQPTAGAAPEFIQGPVLINLKKDSINQIHSYIKA